MVRLPLHWRYSLFLSTVSFRPLHHCTTTTTTTTGTCACAFLQAATPPPFCLSLHTTLFLLLTRNLSLRQPLHHLVLAPDQYQYLLSPNPLTTSLPSRRQHAISLSRDSTCRTPSLANCDILNCYLISPLQLPEASCKCPPSFGRIATTLA